MRTLNEITQSVRSGAVVPAEELRYAVAAYDVLMYRLNLPGSPIRLKEYFIAAECDVFEYVGPDNDPANPDAVGWYTDHVGMVESLLNGGVQDAE